MSDTAEFFEDLSRRAYHARRHRQLVSLTESEADRYKQACGFSYRPEVIYGVGVIIIKDSDRDAGQ